MNLREQVLSIPTAGQNPSWVKAQALDLIDAHRCIDPDRLARALPDWMVEWAPDPDALRLVIAANIVAACEEQG